MIKASASILIFLALFAFVGAHELQRFNFDQGMLRFRNLATNTLTSYSLNNFTNNTAVNCSLGGYYLGNNAIASTTQTDMLLFLYTNATGFCNGCTEFVTFNCSNNNCGPSNVISTSQGPHYSVTSGNPFNFSNLTIGNGGWQLQTTALYYQYYTRSTQSVYGSGSPGVSNSYIRNGSAYGFIGLGVGGNASSNFQTSSPIFSLVVNGTGSGQLIFGQDTTQYSSSRTPMVLSTDTNWTVTSQNMSLGPNVTCSSYYSNVIFDLQFPGIGIPNQYFYYTPGNIMSTFASIYNLTSNGSLGTTDFSYIYNGVLGNLPNFQIGLSNGQNITLPPSAYTRQVGTNQYAILFSPVNSVNNYTNSGNVNYTVLGWPVLSQFYTLFQQQNGNPTVTLFPTYNATADGQTVTSTGTSLTTIAIVAAIVLIVLVVLSAACKKKNQLTKSDLGVELRAARV